MDLLDQINHPIAIISDKGLVIYGNPALCKLVGFSQARLNGKSLKLLFNNDLPENFNNEIIPALEKNNSWNGDVLLYNSESSLLKIRVNVELYNNHSTSEKLFICSIQQNHPATELYEKVNEIKVIFRSLFQKTSDILFLYSYNENGIPDRFMDVNKTACSLLGFSKRDMLELTLLDIIDEESRISVLNLKETLQKQPVSYMELTLNGQNQQSFHIQFENQYVNYDGQQAILMIGKNISEQKELQNKLSQIEKLEAVGQLAGGIAHDFNNVLAGISGLAELALKKLPADHKAAASIKTIYQKANNSANMVRQLVAFSRKQQLSTKVTDLNKVIKGNRKLLERYLGENITFNLNLYSVPFMIKADQASLDQIITNLCINARDAMPDGGELEIKTLNFDLKQDKMTSTGKMLPGKYILLSVRDTGIGMSPETIRHIFEPFFTTKDIGYGTGLGLSIVYGLIKQHDGFIECQSEVGAGTCFDIYFPWYADYKNNVLEKKEVKKMHGDETILVVEDEADLILYLKETLEMFGYNVLIAHNGVKALEVFEQNIDKIDMIVSDVVMPEMGGVELKLVIQNIKADVKFLLISAYTNRIEPDTPFLPKPFQSEELAVAVRDILDENYVFDN